MITKISGDKFIRWGLSLIKLKMWIFDELLPLLIVTIHTPFVFSVFFQPPIIVYLCLKWRGWIFIFFLYYLWLLYDLKTMKTKGRK